MKKFERFDGLFFLGIYHTSIIFRYRQGMGRPEYIAAGLLLLLQALIISIFYRVRPKWVALLNRHYKALPDNVDLSGTVSYLFFTGMIIVFTFILPFGVYLRQPIRGIDILAVFAFSVYFFSVSAVFAQSRWRHLPVLSLMGVIYTVFSHPVPNPTASTLILLIVFCFEMAVKIAIQVYKAAKSDIEAF